jgi:hypothetical protein
MGERPRSKANQLADDLVRGSLSKAEQVRRGLLRPALRLSRDAPSITINEATSATQALAEAAEEQRDVLALRKLNGDPIAVVLSVDRYLELVGHELANAPKMGIAGRLTPEATAFTKSYVEPADPGDH